MLLSVFCGPGGFDLGFEQAGFRIGLALDKNEASLKTYRHNRARTAKAAVADLGALDLPGLDKHYGGEFSPTGLIGGPPCQSFSKANHFRDDEDPRHRLPIAMARLASRLNKRNNLPFVVMENVPELAHDRHKSWLNGVTSELTKGGFTVSSAVLNSADYGVPQKRKRLFVVGLNTKLFGGAVWEPPPKTHPEHVTVKEAIGDLPKPTLYARGLTPKDIAFHPNHWCMAPKSPKFKKAGALEPGRSGQRSFKALSWTKPSITVAYGHREVHIHPSCTRRLSILEAMRLQGFPDDYVLTGTLSDQIEQVSEAVPPPLAKVVAKSILKLQKAHKKPQVRKH